MEERAEHHPYEGEAPSSTPHRAFGAMLVAQERAEHHPEEGVHRDLVEKHAAVRDERRPRAVLSVGMEAVDDRHPRPENDVLELGGDETLLPASATGALERGAEHGAVRQMDGETDR